MIRRRLNTCLNLMELRKGWNWLKQTCSKKDHLIRWLMVARVFFTLLHRFSLQLMTHRCRSWTNWCAVMFFFRETARKMYFMRTYHALPITMSSNHVILIFFTMCRQICLIQHWREHSTCSSQLRKHHLLKGSFWHLLKLQSHSMVHR